MSVNPCRLLTAAQAKKIDSELRKKLGISTLVLMENAGGAVSVVSGFGKLRAKPLPSGLRLGISACKIM
ncbi:MAG: hypothetical protein Q8L26_07170 [Candidatus Omnitrophota bacterium]|nr:hypothetical protein [Candidatus Omnitrophota bacterium]